MKYSQYHEIRDLFENEDIKSRGYTYEDWNSLDLSEKSKELNEILGIAALTGGLLAKIGLGAAGGLFAFNKNFRQSLLSWGLKKIYLKKLNNIANNFKKEATKALQKAYAQLVDAKKEIKKNANVESMEELPDEKKKQVLKIENQIVKVFNQTIDKLGDLKSQQVEKMIDNKQGLKDTTKISLKFAWESLSVETKVALLVDLMKSKVIESDKISKLLDNSVEEKTEDLKNKSKKLKKELSNSKKEEGDDDVSKDDENTEGEDKSKKSIKVGEKYKYTNKDGKIIIVEVRSISLKDDEVHLKTEKGDTKFVISVGDAKKRIKAK